MLGGLSKAEVRAENAPRLGEAVVVVEHLRLQVPQESREHWMVAERGSWEPWLKQQPGFLGRELFWDPATEEGTLLIRWSSREEWKSISMEEVETVQERFETLAREQTGQRQGNPFPLVFEGELLPQ
ncbi:TIGR03792 family protein [Synechococcus sp. MU1617]|uniref:TIGR03792 family protein n=1 Tax=Synechococcus sp. MU1617 TaxID=2508346 RepID=UPI00351D9DC1